MCYHDILHVHFLQQTEEHALLLSIDLIRKWRPFQYPFVYIQISPTSLVLWLNFQKNMLLKTRLVGLIQKNIEIAAIYE